MLVADIKDRRSAIMAQAKKYAPAFIAANKLLKENGLKPFDLSTLTLKDFNLPEDNSTDNDDWSSMCACIRQYSIKDSDSLRYCSS